MTVKTRAGVRELADRLSLEYAGALPPGQVLALVFRANRSLGTLSGLPGDLRIEVCEQVVRRLLTDRLALYARPAAS